MEREKISLWSFIKKLVLVALVFIATRAISMVIVIYVLKPVYLIQPGMLKRLLFLKEQDLVVFLKFADILWSFLFVTAFIIDFLLEYIFFQETLFLRPVVSLDKLRAPFVKIIAKSDEAYRFLMSWWIFFILNFVVISWEVFMFKLPLYVFFLPVIASVITVYFIAKILLYKTQLVLVYNTSNAGE